MNLLLTYELPGDSVTQRSEEFEVDELHPSHPDWGPVLEKVQNICDFGGRRSIKIWVQLEQASVVNNVTITGVSLPAGYLDG